MGVPNWKNVKVDWEHIIDRHSDWGKTAKQSGIKDIFTGLNEEQIRAVVEGAYKNPQKFIRSKGQDNMRKMIGEFNGWEVHFFINVKTKILETSYPKVRP